MVDEFGWGLAGRRVLVTGAGQGVGQGLAEAFARAGATALVNDRVIDRADDVVQSIRDQGFDAESVVFDVTDGHGVAARLCELDRPVDVLVNNAGNAGAHSFTVGKGFAESSPAEWERFIDVNLYGVMHCTHAVLSGMLERGWGRIITVVSDAARVGDRNCAAYAAAKAGAAGFTRSIAAEGGAHGVTANCIALGTMRTPLTEAVWSDPESDQVARILRNYRIRRPGTADDVVGPALLLAGERGSWITGQTIPVNGGFSFAL